MAMVENLFSDSSTPAPVLAAAPEATPEAAESRLADAITVRLDTPATTVASLPGTEAATPVATPATAAPVPAQLAPRPLVEVKPDHAPMPLVRSGSGPNVVQTHIVPLQSATVIPRPPTMSSAPVDVPKQMMDALDKYARMQGARGSKVDLTN